MCLVALPHEEIILFDVLKCKIQNATNAAAAAAAAVVVGALDAFCYICRRDAEYHLQNTKEGKIKLEFF